MARNDKILLDQIIAELARDKNSNIGNVFEYFGISQLLKDYDLSSDELELGMVDGRDDGGIDGWYTFVDGILVGDTEDLSPRKMINKIDVWIISSKHHDTFKQDPIVQLYAATLDLLDLSRSDEELVNRYNESVLACRSVFKDALIKSARGTPKLSFKFCYVSRGDRNLVSESIRARSDALIRECHELFSNCEAVFQYIGAAELLTASRKIKDFSAILKFEEGPISRGGTNYLGLARLCDYVHFISAPNGNLRRYLFESNVRDFMGQTFVNSSITSTLHDRNPSDIEDFWWLNNGVTVIADKATVIGKELHLENVQIVNGLQTTESVYQFFSENRPVSDDRCILVKILVTPQKALADKIILATNNQNKVDLASLHATDKIQRDIEDILLTKNWYYDRRKNYYLNHGKPQSRIVSMTFMSWAVMALRLGQPYQCNRTRPKYMQSASAYKNIFSEQYELPMYLGALEFCKAIEATMVAHTISADLYEPQNYSTTYRFHYAYLYALSTCKKRRINDANIVELASKPIDSELLNTIHAVVIACRNEISDAEYSLRRLHRSEQFQELVSNRCLASSLDKLAPSRINNGNQ